MPTRDIEGLRTALGRLSQSLNTIVLPALTPAMLECENSFDCASVRHPKITCVEFAVASSHRLARSVARENAADLTIVLEDDAFLNSNFSEYLKLFEGTFSDSMLPVALHCYPEQYGILIKQKKSKFLKCAKIPDYAVAYILNRAALSLSTSVPIESEFEVADWPNYMKKIQWLAPLESMVEHREAFSFVKESRAYRQKKLTRSLVKRGKEKVNVLLFRFARIFGRQYGSSQIASENLRSFVIGVSRA
jgi:hypothetical protein